MIKYFLLLAFLVSCIKNNESESKEEKIYPNLYEYFGSAGEDNYALLINFSDNMSYIKGYFGKDNSNDTLNLLTKGSYRIVDDTIKFTDTQMLIVNNGNCGNWELINPVVYSFPIQKIEPRSFEIQGMFPPIHLPENVQIEYIEEQKRRMIDDKGYNWINISDFNTPENYPKEIDKCEKLSI